MIKAERDEILAYLETGVLHVKLRSTASNFRKKANKFEVKKKVLHRDGLPVVLRGERKKIFESLHQVICNLIEKTYIMSIAGETAASNLSRRDTFGQEDTATSLKKQKNVSRAVLLQE